MQPSRRQLILCCWRHEQLLTAIDNVKGFVAPLRSEEGGRPPKSENLDNIKVFHQGGTHAAYIVAKLKRDAPEFAERLAAG